MLNLKNWKNMFWTNYNQKHLDDVTRVRDLQRRHFEELQFLTRELDLSLRRLADEHERTQRLKTGFSEIQSQLIDGGMDRNALLIKSIQHLIES